MGEPGSSSLLKKLGNIFVPLIPAFITSGICSGLATLIAQFASSFQDGLFWSVLCSVLRLINTAFTKYLPAWVGYSAAVSFGGVHVMGGVLGLLTCLEPVNEIASLVGLDGILVAGSGGTITVIIGAYILSRLENIIGLHMPQSLGKVLGPFISFLIYIAPHLFLVMPIVGYASNGICAVIEFIIQHHSPVVRMIAGFVCAASFLPVSALSLNFAYVTIYALQLERTGFSTLFPILAMAGASQVGAAVSTCLKTRKASNKDLFNISASGLLPGVMGIGSALLYGVSIPYPKVLLTTCIGAGIGGSFMVFRNVASTGFGASGLIAIPMMTAGLSSPAMNMLSYTIGLVISCAAGFVLTMLMVKKEYFSLSEKAL